MERILELAKKVADEAEVFLVTLEETPVGFEANRLKMLETRESTSVSLRIIKGGRIGFATTTNRCIVCCPDYALDYPNICLTKHHIELSLNVNKNS